MRCEALIRDELAPTLVWIGYAGRQDARDSLPAITPRAWVVYSLFVFAGTPQAVCTGVTFVYTQH